MRSASRSHWYFTAIDPDASSAVTVFCGHKRYIIHNENNHPNRQASDLAHEISHTLLEHLPAPISDGDGRRWWDGGSRRRRAGLALRFSFHGSRRWRCSKLAARLRKSLYISA